MKCSGNFITSDKVAILPSALQTLLYLKHNTFLLQY